MAAGTERRVPAWAVVLGCFLAGAGGIGLFRGLNAQPLPEPPGLPPGAGASLPPAPAPGLPPPSMPVVEPASSVVPPAVPPAAVLLPKPVAVEPLPLPKPGGLDAPLPLPKPTDLAAPPPLPLPKPADAEPQLPLPKPVGADGPLPPPKPADVAAPLPPPGDMLPLPKPATDAPKPIGLPPAESLPAPKPVAPPPAPKAVEPPPAGLPSPPQPVAEPDFNLRPDTPALNVNPKPVPPVTDLPAPRAVEPPPMPKPAIEARTTAPGDAPVKHVFLSAVMGAALAGSTPTELAAQEPKPGAEKEPTLKDLEKSIKGLTEELAAQKKKKDDLEKLITGTGDGKALTPVEKGLVRRVEELETTVTALKSRIEALEKAGPKSVSEKTPLSAALAGKGKVVLVNEFRARLSIVVNKTSYPLDPSEMKEVLVPEGELNYELVEFPNAAPVKSTIKEGETVTLRIK